jgi:prepilin-type N-terminal cleavage/methylation domain-containing protein
MRLDRARSTVRAGFTLIEMLVVIAITGMLFGLLFAPLVAGFHWVAREQGEIQLQNTTQDSQRIVTGQIADALTVTLFPDNPTRIDLVMPASAVMNSMPAPASLNADATAPIGSGAEPGQLEETFFVGLADPSLPYSNVPALRISGGLASAPIGQENLYVLWRAVYNLHANTTEYPGLAAGDVDPVAQAAAGNPSAVTADPWFFEDSLKTALAGQTYAPGSPPADSAAQQALLIQMRNYTAGLIVNTPAGPKRVPVAAELTPVAVLGHLDAVKSLWRNGWVLNPLIQFLPNASQNEVLGASQFGTEFNASQGQWMTSAASAASVSVYWGWDWSRLYTMATVDGSIQGAGGQPMPITVLNGPTAGAVITTPTQVAPYYVDPRTGRIMFTQFQVTEPIPIQLDSSGTSTKTVYPLSFPNGQEIYAFGQPATDTFASLVNASTNAAAGSVRPQVIPFSDSLQVVTTLPAPLGQTITTYQRQAGNLITADTAGGANLNAMPGLEAAQGALVHGPGLYAINYTGSPDLSAAPPSAWTGQPYEVPLIQVPLGEPALPGTNPNGQPNTAEDSNITPYDPASGLGTMLEVTYRFTFATLDASGNPLPEVTASYATQRFVHVNVGFRKFDESNATPSDYALSTSVGAGNRVDEHPNAE